MEFLKDETGATAIEYGLVASLIAVALVATFTALGQEMYNMMNTVAQAVVPSYQNAGG